MGFVSFAMPARELFEDNVLGDLLPSTLMSLKYFSKKTKTDFELLIYGIGHRLKYRGINSYSNLSWFLEAKHGCYFKDGWSYDLRDPEIRFEECDCEVCKGLMPQEIIDLMFSDKELGQDAYPPQPARHEGGFIEEEIDGWRFEGKAVPEKVLRGGAGKGRKGGRSLPCCKDLRRV